MLKTWYWKFNKRPLSKQKKNYETPRAPNTELWNTLKLLQSQSYSGFSDKLDIIGTNAPHHISISVYPGCPFSVLLISCIKSHNGCIALCCNEHKLLTIVLSSVDLGQITPLNLLPLPSLISFDQSTTHPGGREGYLGMSRWVVRAPTPLYIVYYVANYRPHNLSHFWANK